MSGQPKAQNTDLLTLNESRSIYTITPKLSHSCKQHSVLGSFSVAKPWWGHLVHEVTQVHELLGGVQGPQQHLAEAPHPVVLIDGMRCWLSHRVGHLLTDLGMHSHNNIDGRPLCKGLCRASSGTIQPDRLSNVVNSRSQTIYCLVLFWLSKAGATTMR